MATRDQTKVSLFPFMSVLACTIGALVLLLVAMSLSSIGASDASIRAYVETKEQADSDREAIEDEREAIERAETAWARVDQALAERGLDAGLSRSTIDRQVELESRRRRFEKTLAALEADDRRLEEERNEIETTIDVLESRRETLPILIDATGVSRRHKPFFIECDEGGATAYRATDDFTYFVPRDDLSMSGDFARYLRRVQVTPGALLVLLVRPDGIGTSVRAERIAKDAGIRVARLPLPGQGELDWSLLRRAEGATDGGPDGTGR